MERRLFPLAICLSALAGFVDAVGFLELGGYFISFMSGNSTRLAASLATGEMQSAALLGGILALFVCGAMLGVWVRHFSHAAGVLGFVALLLAAAAACHEAERDYAAIVLMTLAMGAENAVFQRNGEVAVGLTYMTGALVKLGQRLAYTLLGGASFAWTPYLMLWMGLTCGGVAGALLFAALGMHALWAAAAWAAMLTLAAFRLRHTLSL